MAANTAQTSLPILYSFRRCPYAIRARLAISYSGVDVEHREVVLKDKPQAMLDISPKGTVPVLQLADGTVIEESLEIMHWALDQKDSNEWQSPEQAGVIQDLIKQNDTAFKYWLDRYKYADRYPEHPMTYYRDHCEHWFTLLEEKLERHQSFLLCEHYTLADMALFPFVRQCAQVDRAWFDQTDYPCLQVWLDNLLASELFISVMQKQPQWKAP
ncbi:MAG: glutathione S-transferase [Pontibacterium sp.]